MGWDAFAVPSQYKVKNPAFRMAHFRAVEEVGTADGLLEAGGLDCRACGDALSAAVGETVYIDEEWSPEKVRRLAARAKWPAMKDVPKEDRWAVVSAREFLNTCAEQNLGIRFSY